MQVEIIPEWQLAPADDRQIAALLSRCFDTDFGNRSFFMQRPHLRLFLRDGAKIVGHMAMTFRAARLGEHLIHVVGLCDVATAPDHRGKGHASTLLQAAVVQARQSPADYFLLFGVASLYAAAGFCNTANPLIFVDMQGANTGAVKQEPAQSLMVLSLNDKIWDQAAPLDMLGPLF